MVSTLKKKIYNFDIHDLKIIYLDKLRDSGMGKSVWSVWNNKIPSKIGYQYTCH